MRYCLALKQHTFQIVLGKGKEVVGCFSTSEVASATPAKHDNLNATITITEISPQAETGNPSRTMPSKENNLAGCFSTFEAQHQLQPLNSITPKQQLLVSQDKIAGTEQLLCHLMLKLNLQQSFYISSSKGADSYTLVVLVFRWLQCCPIILHHVVAMVMSRSHYTSAYSYKCFPDSTAS
ncbi:hypothetical protein P3S67_012003 [Capsicum chacoense]